VSWEECFSQSDLDTFNYLRSPLLRMEKWLEEKNQVALLSTHPHLKQKSNTGGQYTEPSNTHKQLCETTSVQLPAVSYRSKLSYSLELSKTYYERHS
jgi:2-oxo-4-hydroxy-4-carboxy--5-ureidoimidazoline (OHCU) decarboxylase